MTFTLRQVRPSRLSPNLEVATIEILGLPFSAHTRKVVLCAREKSVPFTLVPVVPLNPPAGWSELSPLGKIPVLRSSELTVPDSSVICQYLERIHPQPAIYPSEPAVLARALWIEELVDSGLAPHAFPIELAG